MISNSVTHLRSHNNTTIVDIAGNSARSPTLPCRGLRIEYRYRRIEWPPHDSSSLHRARMSSHQMVSVSWCFKSFSWCFTSDSQCFTMYHNVLHVFHDVLWCFTMFNNVLWSLASRATIGVAASATADRLRDRDNAAGIGDKIRRNRRWHRRDRRYRHERDPMRNSVLNGDWSNFVPGRNIPEGEPWRHDGHNLY